MHVEKRLCEDMVEKDHLQDKERGLRIKQPWQHLCLRLPTLELRENTFLLVKPPSLWGFFNGSPSRLTYHPFPMNVLAPVWVYTAIIQQQAA